MKILANIGDRIILNDTGGFYASYRDAYKLFGADIKVAQEIYKVNLSNTIWTVKNIAIHGSGYDYIYHLNHGKINIVYGLKNSDFKKVDLPIQIKEHNERIMKNFKIKKVINTF